MKKIFKKMKMCSLFKKATKENHHKYANFYETAVKRNEICDAFIDHGPCSLLYGCKSVKIFSKALPVQDIKYIYERTKQLFIFITAQKSGCGLYKK